VLAAETPTTTRIPARSERMCPRPVDHKALATQLIEHHTMQTPPQPVLGPYGEPPVRRRGGRAEQRRQHPPRTTAAQHVHHSGEHRSLIGRRGAATLLTLGELRQQRLRQLPQLVRHQPARQLVDHSRISCCATESDTRTNESQQHETRSTNALRSDLSRYGAIARPGSAGSSAPDTRRIAGRSSPSAATASAAPHPRPCWPER
jgi:hypothetical protein